MSTEEKNLDPMMEAVYGGNYLETGIDPVEPEFDDENGEESSDDNGPENEEAGNMEDDDESNEESSSQESDNESRENDQNSESEEESGNNEESSEEQSSEEEENTEEQSSEKQNPLPTLTPAAKALIEKLNAGDDKEIYETLKLKYGHKEMSPEDKMINFLVATRPELDTDDIHYLLASEYGVGATDVDPDDLTPEMKDSLRKQEIARKALLRQADGYFEQQAGEVKLPELPALADLDPGYKEYLENKEKEVLLQQQIEKDKADAIAAEAQTLQLVTKTATEIDNLSLGLEFEMDKGKFDLSMDFKLDDKKKKQLADYTAEYTPTQAEYKQFTRENGEFDMKGYMTQLAERLFAPQIQKALIKQAIAKDRDAFISTELKNSSFNRGERAQVDPELDFETSAMGK